MFWGVELHPCQTVTVEPPVTLHVTRAALAMFGQLNAKGEKVRNVLQCCTEESGTNFVLGSLREGAIEQLPLDLVFSAGKKVTFFVTGPGVVHLSGYFVKELGSASVPVIASPEPSGRPIERSPQKMNRPTMPDPLGLDFVDDDDEEEEDEVKNGRKMLDLIMAGEDLDDDEDEEDFVPGEDSDEESEVSMNDSVREADREELRIMKHEQHQRERREAEKRKEEEERKRAEEEDSLNSSEDRNPIVDVPQTPVRKVDPANMKSALKKAKRPSQEAMESAKKKVRVSFSNRVLEQQYDQETPIDFDDEEETDVVDLEALEKKARNPSIEARQKTPFGDKSVRRISEEERNAKKKAKEEEAPKKPESPKKAVKAASPKKITKMNNGLILEDEEVGNGQEVQPGNVVRVHYVGSLSNGKVFDQTKKKPFSFTLGAGQVIKGWDLGVRGMRVGGRRKLTIPPSLGYGRSGAGPIPPNSTLNFTIRLVNIGK